MKKIYIPLCLLLATTSVYSQIRTNETVNQNAVSNSTAFLDASSQTGWNGTTNIGKGLVFPRVDLTTLTEIKQTGPNIPNNFPTRMDGMLVYNTAESGTAAIGGTPVSRGFYYYKNTSNDLQGGEWVKLSDAQANAQLWAQRQANGVTETYLKPALDNNDFIGYNSNRKYQLNLGEVTGADAVISPYNGGQFQYYKQGHTPYSLTVSSDALLPQAELGIQGTKDDGGIWKEAFFSQNNFLLKENYVSANPEVKWFNGRSTITTSKGLGTEISGLQGEWIFTGHFSDSNLGKLRSLNIMGIAGDKTHSATVEGMELLKVLGIVNSGSTVTNYKGLVLSSGIKGTVDNIQGIQTGIASRSKDENDTYPAHTIKTMRGINSGVTLSPNGTAESDISGISSAVKLLENATANEPVYGGRFYVGSHGGTISKSVQGLRSDVTLDNGTLGGAFSHGIRNILTLANSSTAQYYEGFNTTFYGDATSTLDEYVGYRLLVPQSGDKENQANVERMYGLKLDNVDRGTEFNYAIHTGKGDIRFGQFKNDAASAQRLLAVDTDGKLVVGGDTSSFTPLWAQREVNGITETYLKPALSQGSFMGYKDNGIYQFNIGDFSPTDGLMTPFLAAPENYFFQPSTANTTPYSVNISSDAISRELFGFVSFNNLLKDNAVQNSSSKWFTGNSINLISRDINTEVNGLTGQSVYNNYLSNANLKTMRGILGMTIIGDETYSPSVKFVQGGYFKVSAQRGTVNNATGLKSEVVNYGATIDFMEGTSSLVSSHYKNASDTPAHTVKIMRGLASTVLVSENATVQTNLKGVSSSLNISNNVSIQEDAKIYGVENDINLDSDANLNVFTLNKNAFNLNKDISKAKDVYLVQAGINSIGNNTSITDGLYGFHFRNYRESNWSADKVYGVYLEGIVNGNSENYGLYMENVGNGTANNNYSIYTNAGNVRLGDLSGTGTRMVVANANGVLSTQALPTPSAPKWVENPSTNAVTLTVNSNGNPRTGNVVSVDDSGKILATAFRGTNGADIFPDYVFENYYTGNSTAKADYNFANLSQVEDFVKTNGHLPGYISAKEIKAQGYVDIIDIQLTNVEKIEELYLHLIEKEKEVQDLKKRVEKLEQLLTK